MAGQVPQFELIFVIFFTSGATGDLPARERSVAKAGVRGTLPHHAARVERLTGQTRSCCYQLQVSLFDPMETQMLRSEKAIIQVRIY